MLSRSNLLKQIRLQVVPETSYLSPLQLSLFKLAVINSSKEIALTLHVINSSTRRYSHIPYGVWSVTNFQEKFDALPGQIENSLVGLEYSPFFKVIVCATYKNYWVESPSKKKVFIPYALPDNDAYYLQMKILVRDKPYSTQVDWYS